MRRASIQCIATGRLCETNFDKYLRKSLIVNEKTKFDRDDLGRYIVDLVDSVVKDGGDFAGLGDKLRKLVRQDGLNAVGKRTVGIVVNFDEKAIGPNRDGCTRERQHFVTFASAVAGIDDNRQMASALYGGDNTEVERIACEVRKGAHAAFAEDDVVIALGHHVFGGHEEFVQRGGHSALEENRLLR